MSYSAALNRHIKLFSLLDSIADQVETCAKELEKSLLSGGKLILMGNGGSAADCQHIAAEFVVRYKKERKALSAIALTVDSSILTAHGNDYSYDTVFSRQMEALCKKEDFVLGISTSGNSANVIDAIKVAKNIGANCWGLLGKDGGKLKEEVDQSIVVPSEETARIQEAHIFIGHWLCEYFDTVF